jgi:type II secretory pathway pseudopilin PulG
MKNKLKGFTLIETVLYIGLFSIILLMVVSFMLLTQQSTENTTKTASLYKTSEFLIQHINDTFENTTVIIESESNFEIDQGKLTLTVSTLPKSYTLENTQIHYDGIPISPPEISINKFYLEPIYKETEIIAVRIELSLQDEKDTTLTKEINLLSTLR